ncbi:MAG: tetraacyldisaccharide 4'-kinase [Armatimonadetes bacterium]|nr:tetraacyldisaccharide 4'-kinase [Armatimonadota bacterium]
MPQSALRVKQFFERIWEQKGHPAWILSPLSLIYQTGWRGYLATYQLGLKIRYRPTVPTVCVGNCTAGGSGKTPFTLYLAENLVTRGHNVVVSTSGYGSPHYSGATLAPDGPLDVRQWGDESTMFRELLPDTPLIVGHSRVQTAKIAEDGFPDHILVMDDGFQHLPLEPWISLVIEPHLENDFCFPAGPYREPPGLGAKRASRVLTYDRDIHPLPLTVRTPDGVTLPKGPVQVLCAIAHPQRLIDSLALAGYPSKRAVTLTDHDPMDAGNLLERFEPGIPLAVTAKDYVKLKHHPDLARFLTALVDYRVAPREPDEFFQWLEHKIQELR